MIGNELPCINSATHFVFLKNHDNYPEMRLDRCLCDQHMKAVSEHYGDPKPLVALMGFIPCQWGKRS